MVFYTADFEGKLEVNSEVFLLRDDPYNCVLYDVRGYYSEDVLKPHLADIYPEGLSYHGWRYLLERHTYGTSENGFQHNISFFIEMNFEYVRKLYFPDKPSRFQSIFACESLESLNDFINSFREGATYRILTIKADDFHVADMHWLKLATQNISASYMAHKYWEGAFTSNPFKEVLVKLPCRTLDVVG